MPQARHRIELELKLIMRRAVATTVCLGLFALPLAAAADDTAPPQHATAAGQAQSDVTAKPAVAAGHDSLGPNARVSPFAITAKRTHPHLDLRLSSDRLNRVLTESGVEPVPESDTIDAIEVTAHHVRQEPITQGIPAIYYGITHPTEAWRIFAPIQP
jgi:hypothetical protein